MNTENKLKDGNGSDASTCSVPPRVHDWVEDFGVGKGIYLHQCIKCNSIFEGHIRRILCKVCGDEGQKAWRELSKEEKEKRHREVSDYFDPNVKALPPADRKN